MSSHIVMTTVGAVIAGMLIAVVALSPSSRVSISKTDRLGGEETQTAFLPERFGVPSSSQ